MEFCQTEVSTQISESFIADFAKFFIAIWMIKMPSDMT